MNTKQCEYCRKTYSKYLMQPIQIATNIAVYFYICKHSVKCIRDHDEVLKTDEYRKMKWNTHLYMKSIEIRKPQILKNKLDTLIENGKNTTTSD